MMEEWINEEGEITTFSFNIYTYYGVRDNAIINVGLTKKLLDSSMSDVRYYIFLNSNLEILVLVSS